MMIKHTTSHYEKIAPVSPPSSPLHVAAYEVAQNVKSPKFQLSHFFFRLQETFISPEEMEPAQRGKIPDEGELFGTQIEIRSRDRRARIPPVREWKARARILLFVARTTAQRRNCCEQKELRAFLTECNSLAFVCLMEK